MMTTIQEALAEATQRLLEAGVDSPHLDAQLLLAHTLGVDRIHLLAHPEQQLAPEQIARYEKLILRRQRREPLAYLIGRRWFYGLEFEVTPDVLIPRPETEHLVDAALSWLAARPGAPCLVADIGVGSGAIAVTLATRTAANVRLIATDISAPALAVARRNAERHGVLERITFLQGEGLDPLSEPVHLILANLPYVATEERPQLMPEVRDYEPAEALFAGAKGLQVLTPFLGRAPHYLRAQGALFLEIGHRQGEALRQVARRAFPQAKIRLHRDLAGWERILEIQT